MRKLLVLQHVPYEPLGLLDPLLRASGFRIRYVNFGREPYREVDMRRYDGLVVLGGPMNVDQADRHPHLGHEVDQIRVALERDVPVLGICLGAQLIARTLGAEVTRNAEKEIGWFPIKATSGMGEHPLGKFFANFPMVLHWHGDTFAIPDGAVHLAQSVACTNQVFLYGNNVLALQCHLEMARPHVERLCDACADELREGGRFVQPVEKILAPHVPFASSKALLDELLDAFAAL